MPKKTRRFAWVAYWQWCGGHRQPEQLALYFFRGAWSPKRVSEHLQLLFINSREISPLERLHYIKPGLRDPAWERKINDFNYSRVSVGHNPMLVAELTRDLEVIYTEPSLMEVSWTPEPVYPLNWTHEQGTPPKGNPRKFLVDWNASGEVAGVITQIAPKPI